MAFGARARAAERSFDAIAVQLERVLGAAARPAPRVWLVSPDPGSRGGIAAVARQMVVSPLSRRYRLSMFPTHRAGSALGRLYRGAVGIGAIAAGLLVRKPDLVHLKLASRGSFARKVVVGTLCRLTRVPVLVHVHGGGFDRFVAESPPPVQSLARWLLEGTPQVLSLSERWAEKLRPLFPRARIDVLANPVEVARLSDIASDRFAAYARGEALAGPPTALFLGEIVERKGVDDLVAVWPEVARAMPGARLVLAGTGDIERVRAAAHAAGVADLVETPGWIDFAEKRERLRAATLFVLPSFTEGVPISLLEAMAAGLPSVVTPVGGVLDAVSDGQEALVVAPGDRAGLVAAILSVFQSPTLARALGGSARLRVDAFDITVYAARLDEIYRAILGVSGSARRAGARAATSGGLRHEAAR